MDDLLSAGIRTELRAFVHAAGHRRTLLPTCHVGHPGGAHCSFAHDLAQPASLRADLVERAIDGLVDVRDACGWLTRSGELDLADADAEWHAATRTAFARHGLRLPAFFVLNRTGWVDLVSGEQRRWTRVRHPRQR